MHLVYYGIALGIGTLGRRSHLHQRRDRKFWTDATVL
jgi:hypothetical protein